MIIKHIFCKKYIFQFQLTIVFNVYYALIGDGVPDSHILYSYLAALSTEKYGAIREGQKIK